VYKLMDKIKAKLFSMDFDVQFWGCKRLYGNQIKLSFTNKNIDKVEEC